VISSAARGRVRIALAAALLFVLQALASTFVAGAQADGLQLDAFGNPLCITSGDHSLPDGKPGGHKQATDCCTLFCSTSTAALGPPPQGGATLPAQPIVDDRLWGAYRVFFVAASDHDPRSPRAPPLTA
jgi:hypothetical protein